ncbi:glucuronate isomerase [Ruminiclostridium sufflavum DSM 19573]|uniref:Uronate isomerase n=1 Tax=Ruminiclostridium sufflavum DSM 19573 TaxID=1121337 RepID=A0A318XU35_9FIRM|nr:glucuronate isomerase [Ruminiclostridium sufflavum]PYG85852.1 glucuronate isomerase [Ruminiclostridium sufflavum DSM 19573]
MLDNYFMLKGRASEALYNQIAKGAPIYDFHCHLSARDIYEDKEFKDIASLWLGYDHYKWRAMRYAGIPEKCITGNSDGLTKFKMWAKTCERLAGSPLYHWANMELKSCFGINEFLKESNAEEIFYLCSSIIKSSKLSPVKMIEKFNVRLICTTDDPADSLAYHKRLNTEGKYGFMVFPTFRPDRALNILKEDFTGYIEKLSESSGVKIESYEDIINALKSRIQYFRQIGCVLADHSLESMSYFAADTPEVERIFSKRLGGEILTNEEAEKYKGCTLKILASEYRKAGLAMQLHIGALRNVNETMHMKAGADAGFDIMNDFCIAEPLVRLLDDMDRSEGLPKTILYSLNSKDNLVLSSLCHCYTEDGIPGKVQFGAAWWFNDHKEGIREHLSSIANQGMLAYFVGMLTDSRSFLSYVRHDYFRRILCSFIGELVDNGEFDKDEEILKELVEGICFRNIQNYLGL